MLLADNLNKYFHLGKTEKLFFLEAVIIITVSSVLLKLIPFRYITRLLGKHMVQSDEQLEERERAMSVAVGCSVRRAAKSLPWRPACFPQAMAAKFMLGRQDISSTLFLGVSKNSSEGLSAHAWLSVGELIVAGASHREQYAAVSYFS